MGVLNRNGTLLCQPQTRKATDHTVQGSHLNPLSLNSMLVNKTVMKQLL